MSEDAKKPAEQEDGLNRRQFFVKLGVGSVAVAACGTAMFGYEFLSPNVLYEPSPLVNIGKADLYAPDSVTLDPQAGIFIVRASEGFYALTAICTHLGCITAWKPELGIIACPCHGSKFNKDGTKIAGPAPRPLPRLKMWVSDEGDLMVDRSNIITGRELVRV